MPEKGSSEVQGLGEHPGAEEPREGEEATQSLRNWQQAVGRWKMRAEKAQEEVARLRTEMEGQRKRAERAKLDEVERLRLEAREAREEAGRAQTLEASLKDYLEAELADLPEEALELLPELPLERKLSWVKKAKGAGILRAAGEASPGAESRKPPLRGAVDRRSPSQMMREGDAEAYRRWRRSQGIS